MSLDPITTVRLLKGSSAKGQILLAFVFARAINGLDINDLKEWTDLGREAIYHACDTLERQPMGMLTHVVNAHGQYRWYPTGAMLPIIRELNHGVPELSVETFELEAGERQESPEATPGREDLVTVLRQYKITGRKRQELLACSWVTAEYISAHVIHAQSENVWDNPIGMAITRMLDQEPAPQMNDAGHPKNCNCVQCKIDRFMNDGKRIPGSERRRRSTPQYSKELIVSVAEFMEHDPGCDCLDCQTARLTGINSLCQKCRHYNCECPDESDEP